MGSTNSKSRLLFPVPRHTRNRTLLINEALARNDGTQGNFLSSGLPLYHLRGTIVWSRILERPNTERSKHAITQMGEFADVVTVTFTDWSAGEVEVLCSLPVTEAFLHRVTSTSIANWVYLSEHATSLEQRTSIQDLIKHVCERL